MRKFIDTNRRLRLKELDTGGRRLAPALGQGALPAAFVAHRGAVGEVVEACFAPCQPPHPGYGAAHSAVRISDPARRYPLTKTEAAVIHGSVMASPLSGRPLLSVIFNPTVSGPV
jgi:hypothetical protein